MPDRRATPCPSTPSPGRSWPRHFLACLRSLLAATAAAASDATRAPRACVCRPWPAAHRNGLGADHCPAQARHHGVVVIDLQLSQPNGRIELHAPDLQVHAASAHVQGARPLPAQILMLPQRSRLLLAFASPLPDGPLQSAWPSRAGCRSGPSTACTASVRPVDRRPSPTSRPTARGGCSRCLTKPAGSCPGR